MERLIARKPSQLYADLLFPSWSLEKNES